MDNIINIKSLEPQTLIVGNGLQVFSPHFLKSLDVDRLPCDVYETARSIKSPPTQYWARVHVLKNVHIIDSSSDIADILNNAVSKRKNNVVVAPVSDNDLLDILCFDKHTLAFQVRFGYCLSGNYIHLNKLINGINLNELVEDAFLKESNEPQV